MGRLLFVFLLALPASAAAHRGGLDDQGGHHDRRTGEYHCHRAGCRQPPRERRDPERDDENEPDDEPERPRG
ncbi:MAG: YHYH domain-containing protein [Myxococcales bacterium]|nr:YHYH domain-containing protein [Myxococcales bacterium]